MLASSGLMAQTGMGMRGGPWEGIWGVAAQPASILICPDKLEVNVLLAGADVDNSYFHLGTGRLGLFGFSQRIKVDGAETQLQGIGSPGRAITTDVRILLPSFSMRIGQRNAIAFTNAARSSLSATGLDVLARQFGMDTIELSTGRTRQLDALRARLATMGWTEHGITFGHTFGLGAHGRLHLAATAKVAVGIMGGSLAVDPATLTGLNDSTTLVSNINADLSYASPPWPVLKRGMADLLHGTGWNGDLGVAYTLFGPDSATGGAARLSVGMALTDLGAMRFNKNAEAHRVRNGSATMGELTSFGIDSLQQLGPALSGMLLGDPGASLAGRAFSIQMPMAAHLSAEYRFARRWVLRSELAVGLRQAPRAVAVRDVLAVVPRFESRLVSVAMPLSADRVGRFAAGLMVRVGGFAIGSDRIGGLFGLTEVAGADIYFGAKVRIRGKADGKGAHAPSPST